MAFYNYFDIIPTFPGGSNKKKSLKNIQRKRQIFGQKLQIKVLYGAFTGNHNIAYLVIQAVTLLFCRRIISSNHLFFVLLTRALGYRTPSPVTA